VEERRRGDKWRRGGEKWRTRREVEERRREVDERSASADLTRYSLLLFGSNWSPATKTTPAAMAVTP
jgi:hypothetical protein